MLTRLVPVAAAAALGAAVAAASSQQYGPESTLCVLIGVLTVAPLAHRWMARSFDLFEPAVIIAVVYFVYFVFAPLVRFATVDLVYLGRNFEPVYFAALSAALVAVVFTWLGYALPIGPRTVNAQAVDVAPAAQRAGRRLGAILVVAAVACMTMWARIAHRSMLTFLLPGLVPVGDGADGGTDVAYLFLSIEWFIPALVVLMACGGLRKTRWRVVAVLAVTVVYVSIGFRYRIVLLWMATGMLTYLQRERRPRVRNLVLPGAVAFLAAGWLAGARLYFRSGGSYGSLRFNLRDAVLLALADTRIFETFGAVQRVVPDFVGYAGMKPFTYVFLLPIPRFIWFNKPLPESLQTVASSIGTPDASGAGAFVPHFGEYYLAFGWPGIAVGTFIFGAVTKWLWRSYQADPRSPFRQTIFVLNNALIFEVIIRGYFPQIVLEWCFLVLPGIVLVALARARGRAAFARVVVPAAAAQSPAPE